MSSCVFSYARVFSKGQFSKSVLLVIYASLRIVRSEIFQAKITNFMRHLYPALNSPENALESEALTSLYSHLNVTNILIRGGAMH